MLSFINIINRFVPKQTIKPLGRWQLEYCSKKIDIKIDLANEDHCGSCKMSNWEANKRLVQNTSMIMNSGQSGFPRVTLKE